MDLVVGELHERDLWNDSIPQPREARPVLPLVDVTVSACRVCVQHHVNSFDTAINITRFV